MGSSRTYVATFLLTLSNPVTILSFAAIYAAWHVPEHDWSLWRRGVFAARRLYRFGIVVGGIVSRPNGVSATDLICVFCGGSIASQVAALPSSAVVLLLSISPLKGSLLGMP